MRCSLLPRSLPGDSGLRPRDVRFTGEVTDGGGSADGPVWIDVPERVAGEVVDRLDAWLLWLLPYAFETQQELILEGPVDPELLRNAHELMEVWSRWWPERRPIAVRAEPADPPAGGRPSLGRTALYFTAGVDSYFTLFHHDATSAEHPEWRQRPIDDLVYVWGFDVPLAHRDACERKERTLARIAAEVGKELVTFATNLRDTGIRRPWGKIMHGPALGGVGLLLGNRWKEALISSWFCHEDNVPWGSTGITDPLLSTSSTRSRVSGAGHDRFEKTARIVEHPIVLETLHVCWEERAEINCGRCEKCYRTLLALEVLGVRERATTFPQVPLDLGHLAVVWKPEFASMYAKLRSHAARMGRGDVAAAIDACLARPGNV